jgi:type I restriction enzyme, S subunit
MMESIFSIYKDNPQNWQISPLGYLCDEVRNPNRLLLEENRLSLSYGRVVRKDIESTEGLLPESFDGYNIIENGDVVLRLTDLQNDQKSLRVGLCLERGIITSAYTTVRSRNGDSRWLYYTLHSYDLQKIFYSLGSGLRQSMGFEDLKSLPIASPEPQVQTKICDFLDQEILKLDTLIRSKKQQIDQVGYYFDAIVREEILGVGNSDLQVPKWATHLGKNRNLVPLGKLVRQRGEKNDPIVLEEVLSLTAARGVIRYEDKGDIGNKASEDISRYSIVRINDLVINSMNVIIGSVGLSKYDGVLSPVYYVLMPVDKSRINMEYLSLHFRIREFQRQLIRLGYGILDHRMRIPWINLKSQEIVLPDMKEQERIVLKLRKLDEDRMLAISNLELSIRKIEQFKISLINSAMVGSLDIIGERISA